MEIAKSPGGTLTEAVACPRCGGAMNRHAEKLVSRGAHARADAGAAAEFDGVVEEFLTCGSCRYVLERRSR